MMDFGEVDRVKRRRGREGKRRERCRAQKVKGGRWMAICPHKRPRFISEGQAHAMNRGRRRR